MASYNYKFLHIIAYASLICALTLCVFYTFVLSVVRKRDIERYRVQQAEFVTNVQYAVYQFLQNYVDTPNGNNSFNNQPKVIYQDFGYCLTPLGQSIAIFPNGAEYYIGDYNEHGLIRNITDRAVYCVSSSNTITIIRRTFTPKATPRNDSASAESSEGGEEEKPAI